MIPVLIAETCGRLVVRVRTLPRACVRGGNQKTDSRGNGSGGRMAQKQLALKENGSDLELKKRMGCCRPIHAPVVIELRRVNSGLG